MAARAHFRAGVVRECVRRLARVPEGALPLINPHHCASPVDRTHQHTPEPEYQAHEPRKPHAFGTSERVDPEAQGEQDENRRDDLTSLRVSRRILPGGSWHPF
jgi:hypothetical protein